MDLTHYEAYIAKHRPQLKPNSVRTYARSLKVMAPEGTQDFEWVKDVDYVLKRLESYKDTTKKNNLNAVIVVLDKESEAFKRYTKERDKYNVIYTDHNKARKKTESQEKNWVSWPDYLKMVESMGKEARELRGELSKREATHYQDYLLTLLYSHYPLRNDFADVKVISATQFKKLTDEERTNQNYLVKKDKSKYSLILNEYKTSQKYGQKTIEMNDVVTPVIKKWLAINTSGYLLRDPAHPENPLGSNGVSKAFARIGLKRVDKRLGSSLLRHSYLSHKYADDAKSKEADADLMMHSVAMQDDYIKT